jgi:hypothetical protein
MVVSVRNFLKALPFHRTNKSSLALYTQDESNSTNGKRNKETTKLTKHGFLDKIKSTAKAGVPGSSRQGSDDAVEGGDQKNNTERDPTKRRRDGKETSTNKPSWSALKDDYMLNPKKVSCLCRKISNSL